MPVPDVSFAQLRNYHTQNGRALAPLIPPAHISFAPQEKKSGLLSKLQTILHSWRDTLELDSVSKKFTGKNTVIAILDTGVFDSHPDLAKKVILKMNAHANNPTAVHDLDDLHGHGTHVAGLVAARQSTFLKGFQGIAPDAEIVSVKVTLSDNSTTSWVTIANGIEKVLDYNAGLQKNEKKVSCILICFNGFDNFNAKDAERMAAHRLLDLFRRCYVSGIPVIVPSGNHYFDFCEKHFIEHHYFKLTESEGLAYPALNKYVISVGALSNINYTISDLADFGIPDSPAMRTTVRNRLIADFSFLQGDLSVIAQRIRQPISIAHDGEKEVMKKPHFILAPGLFTLSTDNVMPVSLDSPPGIYTTATQVGYSVMSGSCQAAAVVAGTVLLLQQKLRAASLTYHVSVQKI
ncbi:MAG: S8 family peptidase, partial [Chitinophagales bacterium]